MAEKVNPSEFRPAEAFKTAGAIALAGGAGDGYVSPASEPSDIAVQDGGITESNLNAFAQSNSGSSLDVTIDGGEAFIYGAWTAIDTQTTVTLSASTADQTVYVGWNKDGTNDVIVGLDSAFDNTSGNTDEKIPLYTFDTDGSGVTSVTDDRTIGKTIQGKTLSNTASVSSNYTTDGDQIIFVDTSGSPVTVTLSTQDREDGFNVIVVDSGGNANTNTITIDTEGSATINGASSTTIETDYSAKAIASDGANWFTSGAGGGGIGVEDDGSLVLTGATNVNFGSDLDATDDGDGTVTVDNTLDPRIEVQDNGASVSTSINVLDFGSVLDVTNPAGGEAEMNLNTGITPTWTGTHQFNAGLEVAVGETIDDTNSNIRFGLYSGSTDVRSPGGGSDSIRLWDSADGSALLEANEGGPIDAYEHVSLNEQFLKDVDQIWARDSSYPSGDRWQLDARDPNQASEGDEDYAIGYWDQSATDLTNYFAVNRGSPGLVEILNARFAVTDIGSDPTANGEFTQNGGDVKVHTGGAVANLSDIGVDAEDDGATVVSNTQAFNFGTNIDVSNDGDGTVTVNHADTSTENDTLTSGATIIHEIDIDGRGHVTNVDVQNRSLDDWSNAVADINIGGNAVNSVSTVAFTNTEEPASTRAISIDDSEGVLFKDSGGNTYPLWNSKYVNAGTDVDISGGSGAGSTPITISHANTSNQGNVSAGSGSAITDINLDGRGHVTSIGTSAVGAFTDSDGDNIAELNTGFNGVLVQDDIKFYYGSDGNDFGIRYDSGVDELRWRDEGSSNTDRMALDRTTGDLTIEGEFTEGASL